MRRSDTGKDLVLGREGEDLLTPGERHRPHLQVFFSVRTRSKVVTQLTLLVAITVETHLQVQQRLSCHGAGSVQRVK